METKDDKSLTTINKINVKLVLGSSPAHESRVLDISEALPKEIIGEINSERKEYECSDPTLLVAIARIIELSAPSKPSMTLAAKLSSHFCR